MKILIAPNSMKGSIDAFDFARAIEKGLVESCMGEVKILPLADGGDGTGKVLSAFYNASYIPVRVLDPLKREIESGIYIDRQGTAIIEMASASGLKLLKPEEYSALNATSIGTGQLIMSAIKTGAKTIIVGLGGSATVDGGMGALIALGVKFFNGDTIIETGDGVNMGNVVSIDASSASHLFQNVKIIFLTDVNNPLLGCYGAVRIFGPQKGATPFDVEKLEKNMKLFAGVLFQETGRDISSMPGGGAAGGIAASFHALFDVEIVDGARFIFEQTGFRKLASSADLIITGEGEIDESTFMGKVPGVVLQIGLELGKPVYAICGLNSLPHDGGFTGIYSLLDEEIKESEAKELASLYIERAALKIAKMIE